ncbi:predicted protein [Sclerotinia sclerotiorum 1980 UF-70]|uniref:Uncharacterized protein n=1 Tax=Sclerotinia sclerotiorum (strain ATCC 18683 / 1980 / Ss-1) TaxID=665079 RepID=A7EB80_SCLS1|nr:predicted protein [Sclerotinia sclerotiorum 1980 UF-70]EDN99708.1 predicted protein [Sclerotinia sclerotiorum 1980 UF-70]
MRWLFLKMKKSSTNFECVKKYTCRLPSFEVDKFLLKLDNDHEVPIIQKASNIFSSYEALNWVYGNIWTALHPSTSELIALRLAVSRLWNWHQWTGKIGIRANEIQLLLWVILFSSLIYVQTTMYNQNGFKSLNHERNSKNTWFKWGPLYY